MKTTPDRNLLVLFKSRFRSQWTLEQEVEGLNKILRQTDRLREFCRAHELVRRNRITQKRHKILNALHQTELKPFWFFIGRN